MHHICLVRSNVPLFSLATSEWSIYFTFSNFIIILMVLSYFIRLHYIILYKIIDFFFAALDCFLK